MLASADDSLYTQTSPDLSGGFQRPQLFSSELCTSPQFCDIMYTWKRHSTNGPKQQRRIATAVVRTTFATVAPAYVINPRLAGIPCPQPSSRFALIARSPSIGWPKGKSTKSPSARIASSWVATSAYASTRTETTMVADRTSVHPSDSVI